MPLSLYGLLEASLLILNGIAVLNKERFLRKIGLLSPSNSFDSVNQNSVKQQFVNLVLAVQTVMRIPLIFLNTLVIVLKLVLG
uniref:Immediate early response 3-interacting protein 1 n=1 Tax=Syphacia muris TaxID=451379 RepID=A0A0N5AP94_9BILA